MEEYLIGTLAKKLCVNKETIRYYERIKLINYDKIGKNSYRYYSENTFLVLKFILEIKKYGFTLKEIKLIVSMIMKGLEKDQIESVLDQLLKN